MYRGIGYVRVCMSMRVVGAGCGVWGVWKSAGGVGTSHTLPPWCTPPLPAAGGEAPSTLGKVLGLVRLGTGKEVGSSVDLLLLQVWELQAHGIEPQ